MTQTEGSLEPPGWENYEIKNPDPAGHDCLFPWRGSRMRGNKKPTQLLPSRL